MGTEFDDAEFVDSEFQAAQRRSLAGGGSTGMVSTIQRPPTREELDTKVTEAQQKLVELKRLQEELERERASLEEARRRLTEFQTGREEMRRNLTRGIGLLEEAEFAARRDAEQMVKTLEGLRDALGKVDAIREDTWSRETYPSELTRALTIVENARMEWNSARLKWTRLSNDAAAAAGEAEGKPAAGLADLSQMSLGALCRLGLALTWPVAAVALAALGVFLLLWLRHG
jgi:DNA repair exonuclease SbcCD ATPase subunit